MTRTTTLTTSFASLALVLAALAASPALGQEEPAGPPEPTLETPYTAAQIASACPVGRKIVFFVEIEGQKQLQVLEFKEVNAIGAALEATTLDDQGKEMQRKKSEVTWEELRSHAEFPAARAKRREGDVLTPAGPFACWIYTVTSDPLDAETSETTFWFAKKLPGPPVRIEARKRDGKSIAYSMTLAENTPGK
jgi:hypothetical protein